MPLEGQRAAGDGRLKPDVPVTEEVENAEGRTVAARCQKCGKHLTLNEFRASSKGHYCEAHRPRRKPVPARPSRPTLKRSKLSPDQAIAAVAAIDAEAWFALSHWAKENDVFRGNDRSMLYRMGILTRGEIPVTVKQASYALSLFEQAKKKGFERPSID